MTREALAEASETLRTAAEEATADLTDRLEEQADSVRDLAEREFDPDHGTLARVETKLGDLQEEAGDEVAERVEAALEQVREFRSGVDGV